MQSKPSRAQLHAARGPGQQLLLEVVAVLDDRRRRASRPREHVEHASAGIAVLVTDGDVVRRDPARPSRPARRRRPRRGARCRRRRCARRCRRARAAAPPSPRRAASSTTTTSTAAGTESKSSEPWPSAVAAGGRGLRGPAGARRWGCAPAASGTRGGRRPRGPSTSSCGPSREASRSREMSMSSWMVASCLLSRAWSACSVSRRLTLPSFMPAPPRGSTPAGRAPAPGSSPSCRRCRARRGCCRRCRRAAP